MSTTNGVSPQVVVTGGLAAVVAVLFGYGCFVSWPALALCYWGVLALFVYSQVKSWCEEDQSIAAFLSLEQKQHEKKLKSMKKTTTSTTSTTNKKSESSKKSRTKKVVEPLVEEVVEEVVQEEEFEEVVEEVPVKPPAQPKKKEKVKKPKIQNQKVETQKVDTEALEALIVLENFEEDEFKVVPSTEQKKQKRAEKQRQEEEQRKKEEEAAEHLAQVLKAEKALKEVEAAAAQAEIRARQASEQAERALQELENLTPPNSIFKKAEQKQQRAEQKQLRDVAPEGVKPNVAPKTRAPQQKPAVQEHNNEETKNVPPPGATIWELRAQEKAEADMARRIAVEEGMIDSEASICPDYAAFGVCPRGSACVWMHESAGMAMVADHPSNPKKGEKILYKRGMLTEDYVYWSRNTMGDDSDEGCAQEMDLDIQKTPLAPGALPFLPWAVREEFSTQFTSLNLGI